MIILFPDPFFGRDCWVLEEAKQGTFNFLLASPGRSPLSSPGHLPNVQAHWLAGRKPVPHQLEICRQVRHHHTLVADNHTISLFTSPIRAACRSHFSKTSSSSRSRPWPRLPTCASSLRKHDFIRIHPRFPLGHKVQIYLNTRIPTGSSFTGRTGKTSRSHILYAHHQSGN